MAFRQLISAFNRRLLLPSSPSSGHCCFSSSSRHTPYIMDASISEFLTGIGKGVETHVEKLQTEIGDVQKLLVTRTIKLRKLGIPLKHRKLILRHTHQYRLGLWRPIARPVKKAA